MDLPRSAVRERGWNGRERERGTLWVAAFDVAVVRAVVLCLCRGRDGGGGGGGGGVKCEGRALGVFLWRRAALGAGGVRLWGRLVWVDVDLVYWGSMIGGVLAVVKGVFWGICRWGGIPAYAGMTWVGGGNDGMGDSRLRGNDGRGDGT